LISFIKLKDDTDEVIILAPSFPLKESSRFNQTTTVTQTGRVFTYTRYKERILELSWDYLPADDYEKLKGWFEKQEGQGKTWEFYPDASGDTAYMVRFWQDSIEFENFMPGGYKGTIKLRVEG